MKEAYCSYEVSKLLKKKRFDEPCMSFWEYELYEYSLYIAGYPISNSELEKELVDGCSAPTHQMAMAWLREVHNIFIEISTSIDLNGAHHFSYTILDKECKYVRRGYTSFDWNYEDAVEAAIKYCLEDLI